MAHDVNQGERDIAAQVRSSLVDRINQERIDLWIPSDTHWEWVEGNLKLTFSSQFACTLAKRTLLRDLEYVVRKVGGEAAQLTMEPPKTTLSIIDSPPAEDCPMERNSVPRQRAGSSLGDVRIPARAIEQSPCGTPTSGERRAAADLGIKSNESSKTADSVAGHARTMGTETAIPTLTHHVGNAEKLPLDMDQAKILSITAKLGAWQHFVPGDSNQLAWTAANLVLKEPGGLSPVLFHGPCGVGKSHLATGLAQQLRSVHKLRSVLHLSSEQFTNDFTEAILGKGLPMFRRKYRDVDALILDDIQFLIGKKATIGELRHTLDNLLKSGRQVVFLADRSVPELEALGPELVARIRGGLVSPMMPLDHQTRFQVLCNDVKRSGFEVPEDYLRQIATRVSGDGRALKGVVKRLKAVVSLHGPQLTWDVCWNAVFDLVQATQAVVRLTDIERVVCDVFGLEPRSLQSDCKTRTISQPRMLAMFLARKYTPAAYKEIGQYFGQRRHSTVISAEKTVEGWLKDNADLQLARGQLNIREAIRHVEANLHVG